MRVRKEIARHRSLSFRLHFKIFQSSARETGFFLSVFFFSSNGKPDWLFTAWIICMAKGKSGGTISRGEGGRTWERERGEKWSPARRSLRACPPRSRIIQVSLFLDQGISPSPLRLPPLRFLLHPRADLHSGR